MHCAKILIVEDEVIVADSIKNTMEKHGYRVASLAASGERALQIAEKENPDLVLMDIVLKGELDGINTAGQIRKQFGIPVIFLTAYSNNEIFQSAIITEPFGYITKPFDDKQLVLSIERALYKSEMEKEKEKLVKALQKEITVRKRAEESLKASESELKKQKLALEQKTIALREVIGQIEDEKNKIKDDVTATVNEVLLPILERLKLKDASNEYIDLLKHHLVKLTSSFSRKITKKSYALTKREIEICTVVESGLSNKEISRLLNISCHTVEKHRNNIRKKLAITNNSINLNSFLQQL